jgi:hypothetical protein
MRRFRITGLALVAVLAISAVAAATATATKLTLSEGGVALAAGSTFEVYTKESIAIRTSQGNFDCFVEQPFVEEGAGLLLEVTTNSRPIDSLRVVQGLGFFGNAKECRTENGFGHADISLGSGPLKLTSTGRAVEGATVLRFTFERGPEQCDFKGPFKGTVNATPTREPLEIEYSGKLGFDKKLRNDPRCPTFVEMTVSYPLSRKEEFEKGQIEEQI